MATRVYPKKRFGRIPELDRKIKRTDGSDPDRRYRVGKQYFGNLTDARHEVIRLHRLPKQGELGRPYEYTPAQGYSHKQGQTATRSRKPKPVPSYPTIAEVEQVVDQLSKSLRDLSKLIKRFK